MFSHAQAPVRIGIAGGGTDLPAWTQERKGLCLSLAIPWYTHAVMIPRPDGLVVASYAEREQAACATEIANGLIRESALLYGLEEGFEVHILSEVTSRGSGLGVSSSIAVSLAACLQRFVIMTGRRLPTGTFIGGGSAFRAEKLILHEDGSVSVGDDGSTARNAWTVEIDHLRRPIGRQDHLAAAHGGLRLYAFEGDEARIEKTFLPEQAHWAADHLGLVPLPDGHDARQILGGVRSSAQLEAAMEAVAVAVRAIEDQNVSLLGQALAMGQTSKLQIPGAVPAAVRDAIEQATRIDGVYGVKVCGAGGGGHLVLAYDDVGSAIEASLGLSFRRVEPAFQGVRSEGWR